MFEYLFVHSEKHPKTVPPSDKLQSQTPGPYGPKKKNPTSFLPPRLVCITLSVCNMLILSTTSIDLYVSML